MGIVYFICFLVGFLYAVVSGVLGHIFGGDSHVHLDASGHVGFDGGDAGLSVASPTIIAAFLSGFGGAGLIVHNLYHPGPGVSLLLAIVDAAVESHRTSRANKLMEPVRKEVGDFDFRAQFGATLQKTALELPALKVTQAATTAKPLVVSDPAALWKDVPEDAVLALVTNYELSANFRSLTMVTVAALWTRNQKEPIYRGRYLYHTPPIGAFNQSRSVAPSPATRVCSFRTA